MLPHTDHSLLLANDRRLGYSVYGPPDGAPVVYCHGNPGSRLDVEMIGGEVLARHHVRLIAPDRPGIGLSTFQPGRRLTDWPADVQALADDLGLERFAVLSVSVGAPYALACALALPERVRIAGVVSGIAPFQVPGVTAGMGQGRLYFSLATRAPWLARLQMALLGSSLRRNPNPSGIVDQAAASFPPADQAALRRPEVLRGFLATLREAVSTGTRGLIYDAALVARPWGLRPEDIRVPVHVWHGGADTNAPPAMGRYLAEAIPNAQAHFYPDEGHLSLAANHMDEVFGVLVG